MDIASHRVVRTDWFRTAFPSLNRLVLRACETNRARPLVKHCSVLLGMFALPVMLSHAQTSFGTQPLGTSTSLSITVFARANGTVDRVKVLTMGNPNQDFAAGTGGSCSGTTIAAGQQCTEDVVFTPAAPGNRMGAVVLLDSSNRTLGTAYMVGQGKGPLAVFVPGNLVTVAGTGAWNSVNDGGPALSADLDLPAAVAVDATGSLYIADREHHRIRRVDAATQMISTVAGNGNAAYSGDDGPAIQAALRDPSGVSLDGAGNLYISDTGNDVVRKVDAQTGVITTVAGTGAADYTGDNGPGTSATLDEPWGITADPAGNVFIADTANHVIRKLDRYGIITTVAGTGFKNPDGSGGFSGDGGPAVLARLNRPTAVALDSFGNAYIADSNNNRIRLVDSSGKISTFAGTGVAGFSGDGGPAAAAQLSSPSGLCVDAGQNLYVSDTQDQVIRKVNAHTGVITTVAGYPVGKAYDGGKWVNEQLYGPIGLTIGGNGNVYVADYYNMRVRVLQPNVAVAAFSDPISVGDTAAPLRRWMENDGTAPLTPQAVTPVSNAAVDAATTSCAAASPLYQGRSCSIGAEFAPTQQGNPLEGEIDLSTDALGSALQLLLVGDALPENATTITLAPSADPAYFGQTVTFTATVTTGKGTAPLSGTVAFYDGATLLQSGSAPDSFGRATFSTATLPIGPHTVTATYTGDTRHYDSTSQPLSETIDEQTSIAISPSANPVLLGSAVTLTATVSVLGGGKVPPDGSVLFYDGQSVLANVPLDQKGTASYTTAKLGRGNHALTASYSGDAAQFVFPSTSPALVLDVLANSAVSLSSTPNPSVYGSAVTFTATVSSNGSAVTSGEVDLMDGATQIGSVALAGNNGTAAFSVSSLSAGSHTVTASYKGSDEFQASTSAPAAQTVTKAATAISISAAGPALAAIPFTLSAAVTPGTPAANPTGRVTFSEGANLLGTAALGQGGVATLSVTLGAGTHSITASYEGDSNDSASNSPASQIAVSRAVTGIDLTTGASTPLVLSPVAFAAAISSNGAAPTGALDITVDGQHLGQATLNGAGTSFNQSFATVGNHTVAVSYGGDSNTLPSTSKSVIVSVAAIPTLTILDSHTDATGKVALFASTCGGFGPAPTGSMQFHSGGQLLGTAELDSNGASVLSPDLAPGTYTITASYDGDSLHGVSKSQSITVTNTVPPEASFVVSVKPASISVKSSASGTIKLAIQSQYGFADTVSIGCLNLPANVSCRLAHPDVGVQANQSQVLDVLIETDAIPYAGATSRPRLTSATATLLGGIFFPSGLFLGIWIWRARRRYPAAFLCLLLAILGATLGLSGCAVQLTAASAAPGTYTIQIGGVGQTSHQSNYADVTLTIVQ